MNFLAAEEWTTRVSIPVLVVAIITVLIISQSALIISESVSRYKNRMSLFEAATFDAEYQQKFADAERLWRLALKTNTDDMHCDPLYSVTDWGTFSLITGERPFGGSYEAVAESHLGHVLCSRAVYYQMPLSCEIEGLYKDALRIWRGYPESAHKGTFRMENRLADLYALEGRYSEAEVMYKETLEAQIKELGEGHYDTVRSRDRLARLYQLDARYSDAEALFKEDLRLSKQPLSYCNRDGALCCLGCLYYAAGRYKDAADLFEKTRSKQHLGRTYHQLGRDAEAETLYKKVIRSEEESLNYDPYSLASAKTDLALLYMSHKRYADAEPLLTGALHVYNLLIDKQPYVLVLKKGLQNIDATSQALAKVYVFQGRDAAARSLLSEVSARRLRFGTLSKFDKLCMVEQELFENVGHKDCTVRTTRLIPQGSIIRASDLEKIEVFDYVGELRSPLPAVGRRTTRVIADGRVVCLADIQWAPRSARTDSAAVQREIQIARQRWPDGPDVLAEEHYSGLVDVQSRRGD